MRPTHHLSCGERQAGRLSHCGGFTMVEIAIALAVIGFALVAIIGVLPSGLEVQKDNREETIINQDAAYFMDALRNGARGADDLTNYVQAIVVASTNASGGSRTNTFVNPERPLRLPLVNPIPFLTNGFNIVGLLGTPKYESLSGDFWTNQVMTYTHALSGPASEKFPQRDTNVQALAFSYRFISEVVSVPLPTPDLASPFTNTPYARHLRANLNEVRLLFRWPMFANGQTGNGRQVFRSQVSGRLTSTNDAGQTLYFFEPTTFVNADVP